MLPQKRKKIYKLGFSSAPTFYRTALQLIPFFAGSVAGNGNSSAAAFRLDCPRDSPSWLSSRRPTSMWAGLLQALLHWPLTLLRHTSNAGINCIALKYFLRVPGICQTGYETENEH
jgi:hypothetical protein